jgi:homopolymeric O-antigen transport system ATP-binding protein
MATADTVVRAEGLGKRYHLGQLQTGYQLLSEVISERLRSVGRQSSAREEFWALRDVGFDVARGETFGIIGHNGAGKSTLLKILARVTPPSEGRLTLRGRVGALLEVGTGFHAELTGRENIFLNGAILGMRRTEIARKFDEIVEFAEVERFIDTPVKRYSSGMYLRLAFSVAAHLEPEVLIVDEVLSVGDLAFQEKCLGRMEAVAGEGRTVLFVSHNLAAVSKLCPRSMLLSRGEKVTEGPTRDVVEAYVATARQDSSGSTRPARQWATALHEPPSRRRRGQRDRLAAHRSGL